MIIKSNELIEEENSMVAGIKWKYITNTILNIRKV